MEVTIQNITMIIVLITIILNLFLAFIVFSKSPNIRRKKFFLIFILVFSIFETTSHLTDYALPETISNIILHLDFSVGILAAYFFFIFTKSFLPTPATKSIKNVNRVFSWGTVILILLVLFSDLIISKSINKQHGIAYDSGPLDIVYVVFVVSIIIGGLTLLYMAYRENKGIDKLQIQYLLFGASIPAGLIISIMLLLERISSYGISGAVSIYIPLLRSIGFSSIIIFTIFTAYAIIKHRLFGIKVMLGELVYWLTMSFMLFSLFYTVVFTETRSFDNLYSPTAIVVNIFLAVAISLLLKWFSQKLRTIITSVVIRYSYDAKEITNTFLTTVTNLQTHEEIIDTLFSTIDNVFKPTKIAMLLTDSSESSLLQHVNFSNEDLALFEDEETINGIITSTNTSSATLTQMLLDSNVYNETGQQLHSIGIDVIIPISHNDVNGILLVGKKTDKDAYTNEDLNLLENLVFYAGLNLSRTL